MHVLVVLLHFVSHTVAPDDYTVFPLPERLPNPFTRARRQQCFDVAITDDNTAELDEQFTVVLTNLVAQTNFSRVTVTPDVANITIVNDDGKCMVYQ